MKKLYRYLQKLWTASIRRQLMLGIILVHAVLMSIFVYDLVDRQREFLHQQSIEQAKSLSKTLAANSTSWVLANDIVGLEETIEAQVNYPFLRYAMVLSPQGRVLAHTQIEKVGLYINDAISRRLLTAAKEQIILVNNHLSTDIASPIFSNSVFIGWARVNLTQRDNEKNLQIISRNGLIYTLLAIIIGALFAYFMSRGITQGLKNIVDVAEGIRVGNQSLRAKISRHDEIGQLGQDLNIMLDTIDKSKRDLQAVMDNAPAVIYAKDREGRYLFINQKWVDLFDKEQKGIIGKTDHEIFEKEFADKFRENDLTVLKTGEAINLEEVAPHDDGDHTYITVKFPLLDEHGKVYAVCGISTDISNIIEIENEKSLLEHQLLHTQKMQAIGQLTGGVAHDFNNLLAVILGYTELSIERFGKENENLNEYLKEIYTAGQRGRELINQMMIFSRKDQSQDEISSVDVKPVVLETTRMLKATFPTSINIKTSLEKDIPFVKSNSGLISQVLMNLCINAKDSLDMKGEINIRLTLEDFNKQVCHSCHENYSGKYVVIEVEDDGEGIANDKLTRIFEPFYTSKKVGEGTGMGLSVVHGIVHKLSGHIVVESNVGIGTSIKILLPISDEIIDTENNKKDNEKTQYDFSDLNILIVDDEIAIAGFLEVSLKLYKANTIVFTNSEEALAYFEQESKNIDLVITDQTMPDMTGALLSKKLLEIRSDIAIILCTGYSTEISEESALQIGVKSFMYKPINKEKLYKIINELK